MKYYLKLVIFFCSVSVVLMDVERKLKHETVTNRRLFIHQKRFVDGESVGKPHSYHFLANLTILNSDNTIEICGGTLINSDWVLTAAHCIDKNPSYAVVVLGELNSKYHYYQISEAETFFVHEDWSTNTLQNDIGLIKLSESTILNKYVDTIQLDSDTKNTYEGQIGTIIVYGKTKSGEESDKLMEVNETIMSNEACKATNSHYDEYIKSTHICTDGTGETGFCSGASGDPLVVGNILVGLASFTESNCTREHHWVFTRVSSYSQWINKTIFNNSSSREIVITEGGFTKKLYSFVLGSMFGVPTVLMMLIVWLYIVIKFRGEKDTRLHLQKFVKLLVLKITGHRYGPTKHFVTDDALE